MTDPQRTPRPTTSRIVGAARARRTIGTLTMIRRIVERLPTMDDVHLAVLLYTVQRELISRNDRALFLRALLDECATIATDSAEGSQS